MSGTIKTRTDYDQEHLEDLQRVGAKTFARRKSLSKRILLLALGSLLLGTGLVLAVWRGSVFRTLLCGVLGALLLVWGIFFYTVEAWTAGKAMGKRRDGNEFTFEKDYILVVQGVNSSRYPYADCSQLLETRTNFYVMLKNGQGIMLDKANVRGGTVDELRAWLVDKCCKKVEWIGSKG